MTGPSQLGSNIPAKQLSARSEVSQEKQQLTVVSESSVENGGKHERLVEELVNALLVGLDADNAVLGERAGTCGTNRVSAVHERIVTLRTISKKTDGLEQVLDQDGLEDVELRKNRGQQRSSALQVDGTHLKLSVRSSNRDGHVVTHDLGGDHGEGLALSGVDLSGHDGRSGLVLGEAELSKSATGSTSEVTDVVGDLHEGDGEDVEGARGLDDGIVSGKSLELVGSSLESEAGDLGDLSSDLGVESLAGVESL